MIAAKAEFDEADALRAQIELSRQQDAVDIAGWNSRRRQGPATYAPERKPMLPLLNTTITEATERARQIAMERDAAVYPASVEVAATVIEAMKAAIEVVLRYEAVLTGLVAELQRIGDLNDSEALRARSTIEAMIRDAKRAPGAPIDFEAGRQLIRALKLNAIAELQTAAIG